MNEEVNRHAMFCRSPNIYTKILREMDYLMEEFDDTEGPLWCKFIHSSDGIIVLEDLKASGFMTVKRSEAQDLDHARLVLRSLGRYHAMAKVLEGRGLVSREEYRPYAFLNDDVFIRNLIYGGRKALVKGMRKAWGKEWAHAADVLNRVPLEEFSEMVKKSGKFDGEIFDCLNHGDCWSNNMLFKYSWDGRPIAVRFVDYQGPHYSTSCIDVIYYLYSSVQPNVRRQNYHNLLELYHESLTSSLDKFGYEGYKPSLEDINNTMERLSFFALNFFAAMFPIMQTKKTDGMDFDLIFKSNGEEGFNISIYHEEGIIDKMGEEIRRIVKFHEI